MRKKNIYINRDGFESKMKEYLSTVYKNYKIEGPKLISSANRQYRYIINTDEVELQLDCYYRDDNTTTPRAVGKNQDQTNRMIEYIRDNAEFKNIIRKSYSIKDFDKEDFDLIIEYLSELEGVEKKQVCNNKNEICFQFLSNIGDKVTLHYYYTTRRFMFQGMVMKLFDHINELISERDICSEQAIVERENEVLNTSINIIEVENLLNRYLRNSKDFLGPKLRSIIIPSIIFMSQNVNFGQNIDHSAYVFPVLRGLEGYIKKLFEKYQLYINKKETFGKYIDYDHHSKTAAIKNTVNINCSMTKQAICECYVHWYNNRHGLFHTDMNVNTSRILSNEDARILIFKTLELIESTYESINSVNPINSRNIIAG